MHLHYSKISGFFKCKSFRIRKTKETRFYVQGVPEKNIKLDPQFEVEQDGQTYKGETINMKNLQSGDVAKGTRIEGLIQLSRKIDLNQPFKVRCVRNPSADFKFSPETLKLLEN